jgi:hypothetical protein
VRGPITLVLDLAVEFHTLMGEKSYFLLIDELAFSFVYLPEKWGHFYPVHYQKPLTRLKLLLSS